MSADRNAKWIHHGLRAAILLLYCAGIALLAHTGKLASYIEGYNVLLVKLAAMAIGAASVYQAFAAVLLLQGGKEADCGCGHDHDHLPPVLGPLQLAVYALFLVPPLFWLIFP